MSFGLKKTDKNIASTNVGLNSINSVVKGTILNGEITSETDIRIDGEINGNINCKAKVIIGSTGSVIGDIYCEDATIEGKFKGNLRVRESLNVRESAVVSGDVISKKLIVQSGGIFNVTSCKMGDFEKSNTIQSNIKTATLLAR